MKLWNFTRKFSIYNTITNTGTWYIVLKPLMKFKSISQVLGNTSNQVETYSGHHWKINSGRLIDNFLGFKIENQWNWSILIRDHFNLKSVYEFLQWFLPPTYSPNDFDDYRWEINYKRLWNYFRTKSHKNTLSQTEVKYWELLRKNCWENADIFSVVEFSSSREPLNPT